MEAALPETNIGQLIPWATTFLKYTDDVINSLPEDDAALDWRPTDAAGGWYLSIREQAMHIADTRHEAVAWITGEDVEDRTFCTEYGGTEKPWQFKPGTRAQIIASLQAGRAAVDKWLDKAQGALFETSESLRQEHEKLLTKLREAGQDTSVREARGPGRIINVLLFLIAHEQSHRSVLQGMLRQRGHEVVRYA